MHMQIAKEWNITHHQASLWLASAHGAALDWAAGGLLVTCQPTSRRRLFLAPSWLFTEWLLNL